MASLEALLFCLSFFAAAVEVAGAAKTASAIPALKSYRTAAIVFGISCITCALASVSEGETKTGRTGKTKHEGVNIE